MLNPTYPKELNQLVSSPYVAPDEIIGKSIESNRAFDTEPEYRLDEVYGYEIWEKLSRAKFTPECIKKFKVLEVCAGTGFLTYHLLARCTPKEIVVNDISSKELSRAQGLIKHVNPDINVKWLISDIFEISNDTKFDLIIGNSFIHHFYDVPAMLSHLGSLLNKGGYFISLHEPSLMSTVLESAKTLAYPLAVLFPVTVNEIARARYKGPTTDTDLWLFNQDLLHDVSKRAGFSNVKCYPWHLLRPYVAQKYNLHLSSKKKHLSPKETGLLKKSISIDSFLNQILPARFFGSFTLVCQK